MPYEVIFDIAGQKARHAELEAMAAQPDFWTDQEKAQKLNKERVQLEKSMGIFSDLEQRLEDGEVLVELAEESGDEALAQECAEFGVGFEAELARMELRRMMSGRFDGANAIMTIQAGAGGVDAQDWADMLLRMYLRWAERAGFEIQEADLQPGDEAGIKSATLFIRGDHAYGWLRAESGVHRLGPHLSI